jgi:hypothetical protein
MSGAHVRPFQAGDVPAAGALLVARHRANRLGCPLLSPRYENDQEAAAQVEAAFALPGASGSVAVRGDDIVGFVLGASKDSPVWGANVWVDAAGHAAAEPELVRDMYGLAAARWVQESRSAHYVLVPAGDADLLRAWYRLGFGQQQALAVRPLPTEPQGLVRGPEAGVPDWAGLTIFDHGGLQAVVPAQGESRCRSTCTRPRIPPSQWRISSRSHRTRWR